MFYNYTSHVDSVRAAVKLQEGISKLSTCCIENKLTVNVKKTKHMIVSPVQNVQQSIPVTLSGAQLDIVHSHNYLGVVIDDKLTFEEFLKIKCNKNNVRIYQLGKSRKFLRPNSATLIYKQTILPVIEYADMMIESGPGAHHT